MGMFDKYVYLPTPDLPPIKDLPKTRSELYKYLEKLYLSEESIKRTAHYIWEYGGKRDGEHVNRNGWKSKDIDWLEAKMSLEVVLDTDFDTLWYMVNNIKEVNEEHFV